MASLENRKKCSEVFEQELAAICCSDVREFVRWTFEELCPNYFWSCAASTTGKYHPAISLGNGGLVRHTKLAVWWGIKLMRSFYPGKEDPAIMDPIVASLILHDLKKNGDRYAQHSPKKVRTHGCDLAEEIKFQLTKLETSDLARDRVQGDKLPNTSLCTTICDLIASHMGPWTGDIARQPSNIKQPSTRELATLVHLADYCAAQKVDTFVETLT